MVNLGLINAINITVLIHVYYGVLIFMPQMKSIMHTTTLDM